MRRAIMCAVALMTLISWTSRAKASIVGSWLFDHGDARDYSGNEYHGVIQGVVDFTNEDGRSCARFYGAGKTEGDLGYLTIPNESAFDLGTFTIDTSFKLNSNTGIYQHLVGKGKTDGGALDQTFGLCVNEDGSVSLFYESPGVDSGTSLRTDPVISVGEWYRVIAGFDGSSLHISVHDSGAWTTWDSYSPHPTGLNNYEAMVGAWREWSQGSF